MTKKTLSKFLIFNSILTGVAFLASPAQAECNIAAMDHQTYESCMARECLARGAYYKPGSSMCIKCANKKTKPSNKLQNCVDKDMSEEEEERLYQEKMVAEAAERERIKASCTGNLVYDEYLNRCVFRPKNNEEANNENGKETGNGDDDGPADGSWAMEGGTGDAAVSNVAVEPAVTEGGEEVYDGPSEEEGVDGNSYTMSTTVRTNDNGNINESTDTSQFTISDGIGGTEGDGEPKVDLSGLSPSGVSGVTTPSTTISDEELDSLKKKTEEAQKEADAKKEEEDLKQYTGLYNGRQILPDIMARHCRIKGEDVAKDVNLYIDCIKQYVSEMNSSNASAKAKAQEEFEILRYKGLLDMASNAMTKSQSILNYENTMNEYNKADQDMQTEFDDNHALIATLSFITDVMNSFRELQAEQLKYMAISGIVNVDPAVVLADEEEETEDVKPAASNDGGNTEIHTTEANTKIEHN